METNELLKKSEEWQEGYKQGNLNSLDKHNKIIIELWDKMNDIEKKMDKIIYALARGEAP